MSVVPLALPPKPTGPITVVGAGKGSGAMAAAVEAEWGVDVTGLVITRDGYAKSTQSIEVVEAAHPIPDARGLAATRAMMSLVGNAQHDGLLIGLWSGGASALLVQPVDGLTLADKQSISKALLRSGVSIQHMNTVRKHLSRVKGGRLAALAGTVPMVNLIISDVVGDDLSVIASGPTVADPSTCSDALDVISRTGVSIPRVVNDGLHNGTLETPKIIASTVSNDVIASSKDALAAVKSHAIEIGLDVIDLGDSLEGEACDLAIAMAVQAIDLAPTVDNPTVIVSGGEATVTMDQDGIGGPNLEFCLALAHALQAHPSIWALACDTDGTDGSSSSAGAIVTPDTVARAVVAGRNAMQDLHTHNSEPFFAAIDGLVTLGPTATNVNDFRAVLVFPR